MLLSLLNKADGETCERCWNVTEEVGKVEEHPTFMSSLCNGRVNEHYTN